MPATISVLPVALPLLHQSWASLPAGEEKKKKKKGASPTYFQVPQMNFAINGT